MNDPYEKLLPYYDAENAGFDEDLYFYLTMASEGSVLELGCGTGRLALPLAQHGFRVTGVDRSAAMLERGKERASALGIERVEWIKADLASLDLHQQFDLVLCTYDCFLHIPAQAEQQAALNMMARHTKVGGSIVLDLSNPFTLAESAGLVVERTFTDERGFEILQQTHTVIDRAAQSMRVSYYYDRVEADGSLKRDMATMAFRYVYASELALMVQNIPALDAAFWGDYEYQPYVEDSPRLIATIEKSL